MKRTPLVRKTPMKRGQSTLKRSRLRRVSARQSTLNAKYKFQRDVYLGLHDECALCDGESHEVHHRKGRGKYWLDESTWTALCWACHREVHDNPQWARANGLLLSRD